LTYYNFEKFLFTKAIICHQNLHLWD